MEFKLSKDVQSSNIHEDALLLAQERDLWCKMLVAVANDSRVTQMSVAAAWADNAAKEFNKRYGKGDSK